MTQTVSPDALEAIKEKQRTAWDPATHHHRDHIADRGRVPVRGGGCRRGLAGARCGGGQWQRCAGGGPAGPTTRPSTTSRLLQRAERRAEADGLRLDTRVADAEDLPFRDAEFDAVLSTFGVMFTPNPQRAAAELLRVAGPAGASGPPTGRPTGSSDTCSRSSVSTLHPLRGCRRRWRGEPRNASASCSAPAPAWTSAAVSSSFASGRARTTSTRSGPTMARSCEHGRLDTAGREPLQTQLVALAEEANRATVGSLAIPSDYLEVVATPRAIAIRGRGSPRVGSMASATCPRHHGPHHRQPAPIMVVLSMSIPPPRQARP